ncbi:MAG TPA: DUF167 family protein [Pseudomonadales bacterium]|nr:DUF167 family protein [Pseudomonadales bacterium]
MATDDARRQETARIPDLLLDCHVVPGAAHSAFAGLHDGRVRIRLHARPVEGAANRELIRFLAEAFGVPKRQVSLVAGASSRRKRVRIEAPRLRPPELAPTAP